jgi:hypothetical protein
MTDNVIDAAYELRARKNVVAWHVFIALILIATVLPMLIAPYTQHVMSDEDSALRIVSVMTFFGANFHVASTGWFYTECEMRSHFRTHPLRYFAVPALLIIGSATAFQLVPSARGYLLVAFFSWQLWHYQKQNIGILSFVAAGTGSGPTFIWERRTLMMAALAGILGFFSLNNIGLSTFGPEFTELHQVGKLLYLTVPILLAVAVAKVPALRTNRLRLAYLFLGASFFLPTFLFDDQISATMGYAIAHGMQYLVFMGVVGIGKRPALASLTMLAGISTLGGLLLNGAVIAANVTDLPHRYAIYGAFVGIVMTHFVLDASLWRLRERFQRDYIRQKFSFVFDR